MIRKKKKAEQRSIPVIDLFAGPGGLGEGFCAPGRSQGQPNFRIGLSIEKDRLAHQTLELRAFFRKFTEGLVPDEYYAHLRGEISRKKLFDAYPDEAAFAAREAWRAELGLESPKSVDKRISETLRGETSWVLIGGPPCQAYSVIGRSRLGGINPDDPRVHLYREYLRIISRHAPPVFVMENVPGLLSSRIKESLVFDRILKDLRDPARALRQLKGNKKNSLLNVGYNIYSFIKEPRSGLFDEPYYKPRDFIIKSENYGIPQARHRVILLGIRGNTGVDSPKLLMPDAGQVSVSEVIYSLPRVRSGLSKVTDSKQSWRNRIEKALSNQWYSEVSRNGEYEVSEMIHECVMKLRIPHKDRGGEFVPHRRVIDHNPEWYHDPRLSGVCNHSTRAHIVGDIHRYLYAACFAKVKKRSPQLRHFPKKLLPAHRNVRKAIKSGHFSDRFRVQISSCPSTTITSHISKDGHYYIHPDPGQCRSLTVREAARLQTFPDNYFFCGDRTKQYVQVGNAVPPLLAKKIAEIVFDILCQANVGA